MRLRDHGEFELIERVRRAATRCGGASGVSIGIGDDAAVLRPRAGEEIAVSTDALVEGVHFRWATQSARTVGRRALAVSLSDLAAMGARPLGFTWALAAPGSLPLRDFDAMAAGLVHEAVRHGCPLVGGNLSGARQTSLTVTVIGAVARGRALTRVGAKAGDALYVTGTLGGAALEVARAERRRGRVRRVPIPRLEAGRALSRLPGVGACIDVSDGLEADLAHLLEASGLHATLDEPLPTPPRFASACSALRLDADRLARSGGEDYELLFTVHRGGPGLARLRRRLGVRVTRIGALVKGETGTHARGWRHF